MTHGRRIKSRCHSAGPFARERCEASLPDEPSSSAAGTTEAMTVAGLGPGYTYYFAIKAQDEAGNASGLSNSPGAVAKEIETPEEDVADAIWSTIRPVGGVGRTIYATTDNPETFLIEIRIINAAGQPLAGKHVSFSWRVDPPDLIEIVQPAEPTNESGYTYGSVTTSDRVGEATVYAFVIEDLVYLVDTLAVRVFAPDDPLQNYAIFEETKQDIYAMLDSAKSIAEIGDFFAQDMSERQVELNAKAFTILVMKPLNVGVGAIWEGGKLLFLQGMGKKVGGQFISPSPLVKAAELWRDDQKPAAVIQATIPILKERVGMEQKQIVDDLMDRLAEKRDSAMQDNIYAPYQTLLYGLVDDLEYETQWARQSARPLPPELIPLWQEDLQERAEANGAMWRVLGHLDWGMQQLKRSRELSSPLWISHWMGFVKTAAKLGVAYSPLDGLGSFALGSAFDVMEWRGVQKLWEEDLQAYLIALNGTSMVYPQGQRAYMNSRIALADMSADNPVAPVPVEAQIGPIKDFVLGHCKTLQWPWPKVVFVEEKSLSTIPITNTGTLTTTYLAYALYYHEPTESGTVLGVSDVAQDAVNLGPGERGCLNLLYHTEEGGTSPAGSLYTVIILGAHEGATYLLKDELRPFTPPPPPLSGLSAAASEDVLTISNPIHTLVLTSEDNTYMPYIIVDNPFTITVSALVPHQTDFDKFSSCGKL